MLKSTLFAAVAILASQSSAFAGDRIALSETESWDLSLYAAADDDGGGLPGGGLAFSLDLEGLPTATLALDYGDGGTRAGDAEGLGLLAAVDLIGGGTEDDAFLRLSYRAGESSIALGSSGGAGVQQAVAIRAGIRW